MAVLTKLSTMIRRTIVSFNIQVFVISCSYLYIKHMNVHDTYYTISNNII